MALSQMTVKTVSFWDLLSPKLSRKQGWDVSVVALTIKLKEKERERDRQTESVSLGQEQNLRMIRRPWQLQ